MKYIVMVRKVGGAVHELPILFPNELVHAHVARALLRLPGNPYDFLSRVAAAGEVVLDNGATCFGRSETLNIESRGDEDARLIKLSDYGIGIK